MSGRSSAAPGQPPQPARLLGQGPQSGAGSGAGSAGGGSSAGAAGAGSAGSSAGASNASSKDSPAVGPEWPRHLKVIRQLGRGAYGTVHLCEDTRNQMQVAVKHVRHAARHGKSILREIRLLARLWHENLLHLLDFPPVPGPDFEDVYIVLPYMPTDLHKVIQSRQALTDKHVQVIVCQILRAMAHLHAAGVAHRDLKPANILLTADCRLKICDFGLSRGDMHNPDAPEDQEQVGVLTEYVVTRWYRAPEVMLLPKQYSCAVDIWSVGCILCEILGRRALFPGKNHIDMVCRVAQVLGTPPDDELNWLPKDSDAYRFLRNVCQKSDGTPLGTLYPMASQPCVDILHALLRWDPNHRLTATQAQEHEYLVAYLPKERPVPPEPFDWSFDSFKPTTSSVKDRLYKECCRFHPQILERDQGPSKGRSSSASNLAAAPPPPNERGQGPLPVASSGASAPTLGRGGAANGESGYPSASTTASSNRTAGYPNPTSASSSARSTPVLQNRSSPGTVKTASPRVSRQQVPVQQYSPPQAQPRAHPAGIPHGGSPAGVAPPYAGAGGLPGPTVRSSTPTRHLEGAVVRNLTPRRASTPTRGVVAAPGANPGSARAHQVNR